MVLAILIIIPFLVAGIVVSYYERIVRPRALQEEENNRRVDAYFHLVMETEHED